MTMKSPVFHLSLFSDSEVIDLKRETGPQEKGPTNIMAAVCSTNFPSYFSNGPMPIYLSN